MNVPLREIPFARPWITDEDRAAVARVLEGHILTHGPECKAFEGEFAAFLGSGAHCVTVSSCMAALHLAWLHFGVGPGDEVIVPAMTHVATAHAVEWTGAKPVFVDCDPTTGNVTPEGVEAALTTRTKGVSVVHFLGIPCDMGGITAVAARRGLPVVEDCALAVGTRRDGRHAGLFGDAGCFSFYPVKHMTTGEGGMFVSRRTDVAATVAKLRAFGVDRTHAERSVPGTYDVPTLGLNYRMSEMAAALGRSQLRRIGEILRRRRENFAALSAALEGIRGVRILNDAGPGIEYGPYALTMLLEGDLPARRGAIVARLHAQGVGTSLYYPQPVPRMKYYREKYGYDPAAMPGAEAISDASLAVPVGPHLGKEEMDYMGEWIGRTISEVRA